MKSWLVSVLPFLLWTCCTSQNVCEEPPYIDFGEIISGEKATYIESDRVQYKCDPGYVLEGSEWITCSGQKWTPSPKCLAPCIVTKQQVDAQNLLLSGNQKQSRLMQHNHMLQFQCKEGYVLTEPSIRKCLDGHMDFPSCISERGRNCGHPPAIENGDIITLSQKQYAAGSSVQFKCQKYYALEGDNVTYCDNGTWTKAPACLEPCAFSLAEMESRKIEINRQLGEDVFENIYVPRGGSVEFTCKTGHTVATNPSQSASVIQCNGNLLVYPECKAIVCSPPQVAYGSFQPIQNQYEYEDTIQTQCERGYQVQSHQTTSQCTENGWSPLPRCIPKNCDYIRIENGQLSDSYERWRNYYFPRRVGETIDYTCRSGFLPGNKETWHRVTCTKFGWEPEPRCLKKCDIPRRLAHGTFKVHTWYKFIEGEEISYSCALGYDPANQPAKAMCTKNGWSPAPRCNIKKTCQIPIPKNEIFNTSQTAFLFEEILHYQCKDGFETIKKTTSDRVVCTENGWSPTPECLPIHCGGFLLDNGHLDPRNNQYQHRDVVKFSCNKGYTKVGPDSAQCYHFGWSPPPPTCKAQVNPCQPPPSISDGSVSGDLQADYEHGEKVEYKCNFGFAMSGSKLIECVDGQWTSLPSCREEQRTCGVPPNITNGHPVSVDSDRYLHGESVAYECNKAFFTIGAKEAVCLHGQWELPLCADAAEKCTRPQNAEFVPNAFLRKKFNHNSVVIYTCGSSQHKTKCVNGKWSPEPECTAFCPPPPQLPNAIDITEMRNYKSGEEISFRCQENFLLQGPRKIKCEDGKWQTPPRCFDVSCPPPPQVANGEVTTALKQRYLPLEKVRYRCQQGYSLFGPFTIKCQDKQWKELPRCIDAKGKCGPPPPIENGDFLGTALLEYMPGATVRYKCQALYNMQGHPEVRCDNGHWTDTPTCIVPCTATEEDMNQNNIRLRWIYDEKIYSAFGDVTEFVCKWGFQPDPSSPPFRSQCREGKLDYPRCIP